MFLVFGFFHVVDYMEDGEESGAVEGGFRWCKVLVLGVLGRGCWDCSS